MKRRPHKEDIRSEQFMCELFGLEVKQLRKLAKEQDFNVAVISAKTRLYDMADAQRMFLQ